MVKRPPVRQRGAAMILALVVVTVVVLLGITVGQDFQVNFKRVENAVYGQQARSVMTGMDSYLRYVIATNPELAAGNAISQAAINMLNEQIALFPIEEEQQVILLSAAISDEQSRLNLNALGPLPTAAADMTEAQWRFVRLLQVLPVDPPIDQNRAMELLNAVFDWLDQPPSAGGFDPARPGGAESYDYQELSPPMRSADRRQFASVSELRLVLGFDEQIYRAILPYVTIFGDGTININTAPLAVIRSLNEMAEPAPLEESIVTTITQLRDTPEGIQSLSELSTTAANMLAAQDNLDVTTDTIRVAVRTRWMEREYVQYSVVQRDSGASKIKVLARANSSDAF